MSSSPLAIQQAITTYLTTAEERGLSANTVASYRYDLERFAEQVAKTPAQVTLRDLKAFLDKEQRQSDATRQRHFSTLNSFYRWLVREDLVECNPLERLKPAPTPPRRPHPLSHESIKTILQAIPPTALRDRTLFTLLYETGLRVHEVLTIRTNDLDLLGGSESVSISSRKSGSKRRFPLTVAPTSIQLLPRYVGGLPKGPLFPGRRLSGNRYIPLAYSAVYAAWKKYCRAAGISATLQQLRQSRITVFFEIGLDVATIQQFLGLRSPQSLAYYLPSKPDPDLLFERLREYEYRLAQERWALVSPLRTEEVTPRKMMRRPKRPRK